MKNSQIKIEVKCPNCSKSLMNPDVLIDDLPSIDIKSKVGDKIGHIFLSTIYGSYNKLFEDVENLRDSIVECSCPHCFAPFPFFLNCECKAPIVGVNLCIGGIIKFCTRNGCKRHSLEFEDADNAFMLFQSQHPHGLS